MAEEGFVSTSTNPKLCLSPMRKMRLNCIVYARIVSRYTVGHCRNVYSSLSLLRLAFLPISPNISPRSRNAKLHSTSQSKALQIKHIARTLTVGYNINKVPPIPHAHLIWFGSGSGNWPSLHLMITRSSVPTVARSNQTC